MSALVFLVFLACPPAPSETCRTVELTFDGSPHQCLLFGQQLAADWVARRPGWRLEGGWRCEPGRRA